MTYLAAEVDQVGVGVVQWEHDSVAGVQLHHDDGVAEVSGRTQRVLPLRHPAEPGGKHQTVLQEDGA